MLVSPAREMPVGDAIVVNLSPSVLRYKAVEDPRGMHGTIPPWKSAMLRQCIIESGEIAALFRVRQRMNLGGVALLWNWYGHRDPQFSRTTPLYVSSQDDVGEIQLDPLYTFDKQQLRPLISSTYQLKLNLWYTPEETDCGIHTEHGFLEVHTQIFGTGRMQKFRTNNAETLYEDVLMPPGFTHDPFFVMGDDRSFRYPWHRYYANTDCIWMAIELHPE